MEESTRREGKGATRDFSSFFLLPIERDAQCTWYNNSQLEVRGSARGPGL